MECKDRGARTAYTQTDDLIETLWNVKVQTRAKPAPPGADLIETLWNVKINHDWEHPEFSDRFNRDIVECKVLVTLLVSNDDKDLIETLWM